MRRLLLNKKGSSLLETAMSIAFLITFVIFSSSAAITIMDGARDGRTAGLAADMVREIFNEEPNPNHSDVEMIVTNLKKLGYIHDDESFQLILSVFENNYFLGHVRSGISRHGSSTSDDTKIQAHGAGASTPGVEIDGQVYVLDPDELMYVVEIYSGNRGKVNFTSGHLPFYEFAVLISKP